VSAITATTRKLPMALPRATTMALPRATREVFSFFVAHSLLFHIPIGSTHRVIACFLMVDRRPADQSCPNYIYVDLTYRQGEILEVQQVQLVNSEVLGMIDRGTFTDFSIVPNVDQGIISLREFLEQFRACEDVLAKAFR